MEKYISMLVKDSGFKKTVNSELLPKGLKSISLPREPGPGPCLPQAAWPDLLGFLQF